MFSRYKPWTKKTPPKKVLFIRLQAMGDTAITIPYIRGFHHAYPEITIHYFTREEVSGLIKDLNFVKKIYILKGKRKNWKQWVHLILLLPKIIFHRYDIVYDLQNNTKSSFLKRILFPKAWSSFDKFSPTAAGERTMHAIQVVGLNNFLPDYNIKIKKRKLISGASNDRLKIIVNPAGFFPTRNWPVEYYLEWAKMILEKYPQSQFLFIGVDRLLEPAKVFEQQFPESTLNLVNKTSINEAVKHVKEADFMLSEDSGLMHIAWTNGVKTLALFGSSRSDWSRPLGNHSKLYHSGDLECGNCLKSSCIDFNIYCLKRIKPQEVFNASVELIENDY